MTTYYLAVDIGASSGRHILSHMENGKIVLEEIHRFENGFTEIEGVKCWDTDRLFHEILMGLKKCKACGKIPKFMGIDTWGVDFVLLDERESLIGNAVSYRDSRTDGMDEAVYKYLSEEMLYKRTGIQKAIFNTVYQLMAVKKDRPEDLEKAKTFLMMPDYLNFRLTGVKCCEYTEASTSQLLNPETKDWDRELLELLGYPAEIFPEIKLPGTVLGPLKEKIAKIIGFNLQVILPACHDTGSAVLAVPSNEDPVYISSGTWSLMGIERKEADTSKEAHAANFTNEGGYDYRFRFLKNIMGLWMIQSVRRELREQGIDLSYDELCKGAAKEKISSLVSCNDNRFLAPKSMIGEVRKACLENDAKVPETPFELAAVVYNSLALCYKETVEQLEEITGKKYASISIVGGGANAAYLNQVTANVTGRTVYAGPIEATAIGNMLVQMLTDGVFPDIPAARECVFNSFDVKTFRPEVNNL